MKKEISAEVIENFNTTVDNAIKKIEMLNIDYKDWNSYYKLLLSTLCLQLPKIRYYDLANALIMANVICKTDEESKKLESKRTRLSESIAQAVQLSKQRDKGISFELYNTISLNEGIRELSEAIKRDMEAKKLAYKGKDGKDYYDLESLRQADADYMKFRNPPIEKPYINNNIEIIDNNKGFRR